MSWKHEFINGIHQRNIINSKSIASKLNSRYACQSQDQCTLCMHICIFFITCMVQHMGMGSFTNMSSAVAHTFINSFQTYLHWHEDHHALSCYVFSAQWVQNHAGPRLDAEKISTRWIVPLSSYLTNIVQSWTNYAQKIHLVISN
jgi:hypothetical protein